MISYVELTLFNKNLTINLYLKMTQMYTSKKEKTSQQGSTAQRVAQPKTKSIFQLKDNRPHSNLYKPTNATAQLSRVGVFDAGEGSKWHIEFNHIKFKNDTTVNFTNQMTKQEVVAKVRDSYRMTNKQLRALDPVTWIDCTRWLKRKLG